MVISNKHKNGEVWTCAFLDMGATDIYRHTHSLKYSTRYRRRPTYNILIVIINL